MIVWTSTKDRSPLETGYYYTYYYNNQYEEHYYKAIYWNGDGWVNWKPGGNRYIEKVEKFIEETRHDYYVPCMMKTEEMIKKLNLRNQDD